LTAPKAATSLQSTLQGFYFLSVEWKEPMGGTYDSQVN